MQNANTNIRELKHAKQQPHQRRQEHRNNTITKNKTKQQ